MPSALEDVVAGQFVQKRVEQVHKVALNLFTRVESSSPLVKRSLESLDKRTAWLSRPLVSKISAYGQPVVLKLDTGLSAAYSAVDSNLIKPSQKLSEEAKDAQGHVSFEKLGTNLKTAVVASSWFKTVDDLLRPSLEKKSQEFKTFFDAASVSFQSLREKGQNLSFEEFKETLKTRLQWDEKFFGPALLFFTNAQHQLQAQGVNAERVLENLKPTIQSAWEKNVMLNARLLYNQSVEYYNANKSVLSVNEMVEGMKAQLGGLWNDRLAQPLALFFENAKKVSVTDLKTLKTSDALQYAENQWVRLLTFTSSTVDSVLPEENPAPEGSTSTSTTTEPNQTLSALASRVSRRLRKRAAVQWSAVKELSATRVKEMIHVDLIAYAETVIDNIDATYHPVQRVQQVHTACSATLSSTCKVASETVNKTSENVRLRLTELRNKLAESVARVKAAVTPVLETEGGKQALEVQKDVLTLCSKTLHWQQSSSDLSKLQTDTVALLTTLLATVNTWKQAQKLDERPASTTPIPAPVADQTAESQ